MAQCCLSHDPFVEESQDAGRAIWVAGLSDGSFAYQDDGRPGVEPASAWLRLAAHLKQTGLHLVSLRLKFRTEWLDLLPQDCAAYYFARGVGAVVGGPSRPFVALGFCKDESGPFTVARVAVPELIVETWEGRDAGRDDPRVIVRG